MKHIMYECGICGGCHPWEWNGDCRDDAHRYAGPDEYAEQHGISEDDVTVRSMDERLQADKKEVHTWAPQRFLPSSRT